MLKDEKEHNLNNVNKVRFSLIAEFSKECQLNSFISQTKQLRELYVDMSQCIHENNFFNIQEDQDWTHINFMELKVKKYTSNISANVKKFVNLKNLKIYTNSIKSWSALTSFYMLESIQYNVQSKISDKVIVKDAGLFDNESFAVVNPESFNFELQYDNCTQSLDNILDFYANCCFGHITHIVKKLTVNMRKRIISDNGI